MTVFRRQIADCRSENQETDRHAAEHDGKRDPGRRAYFANLADCLSNMAVARNEERQTGDSKSKNDCGKRPKK